MTRRAKLNDVKSIIKIIKSVHIKSLKNKKNGFLMSENLSETYYRNLLNNSKYCYVYEKNNNVEGFIIAYLNKMMEGTNEVRKYLIDKYSNEKFIYVFQAAINPDHQRKGIGKKLYDRLLKDAKNKTIRVISSKKPLNKASELFHLNIGFKKIDTFNWLDGRETYIYELKFNNRT